MAGEQALSAHRKYVVGIGCRKNTSYSHIRYAVENVFKKHNIKMNEVITFVSVDLKAGEKFLLKFVHDNKQEIKFYPVELLDKIIVPNPSETVENKIGISSVCEAAALFFCADKGKLIQPKLKFTDVTVAICKIFV
ncbi:cobalamin biosynthesis protein [Lentisphaerota bacterium WC36G]|nr:cobalamin biosynthesis protein [Lentisphaerae bacterium WC36]